MDHEMKFWGVQSKQSRIINLCAVESYLWRVIVQNRSKCWDSLNQCDSNNTSCEKAARICWESAWSIVIQLGYLLKEIKWTKRWKFYKNFITTSVTKDSIFFQINQQFLLNAKSNSSECRWEVIKTWIQRILASRAEYLLYTNPIQCFFCKFTVIYLHLLGENNSFI